MSTPQPASTSSAARTAIIVVAAGQGTRLGAGAPKALVPLAGRPLLAHALDVAVDPALAATVVVVTPPGDDRLDATVAAAARPGVNVIGVQGGETRQASVAAGLAAVPEARRVLVHDAARSLTSTAQFERVAGALAAGAVAVVPGLAVVDTIKLVDRQGRVTSTPERSRLRAVQTPQGFDASLLRRAHASAAGGDVSDDAGLMEAAGAIVQVVEGEERAFKITHPRDLERAERLLAELRPGPDEVFDVEAPAAAPGGPRIGLGIDVHAFSEDEGTELWLAGLHWPGERGLSGHSDGDAVAHAACDALFSAAGIGDLGTHFGTSRPEYAGASGARLLGEACRLVREAGFEIENISVQFVGNRPKFSPRRAEADAALSAVAGAPVSVIATTSDGLGFEGEGAGISARAVALLRPAR
ncbi:2-C-methyl-D-erythritol 4-phosphate cytidylyltransferase [Galactobacter valiniphilus]|uniref:Bifunctional enzyme IspD/IspF n=1 Tax=Galactobacter valiniphilus TaxID=2676122 RepID=A0A399JC74_9MICC|nr:2-C-methyl-D-erythritol 4-phosphate cytidylyltransferase [Galactobacter valiniphilus]RII41839.1 2-C-methyl-D-erythritol 4-phosphate cytidylyltransferase [Galactobacter valiniphilus]